jgi:hypothetical protein
VLEKSAVDVVKSYQNVVFHIDTYSPVLTIYSSIRAIVESRKGNDTPSYEGEKEGNYFIVNYIYTKLG